MTVRARSAIAGRLSVCASALLSCVGGQAPADPFDLGSHANASGATLAVGGASGMVAAPAADGGSAAPFAAAAKGSHFPLVDGASWSYRHSYPRDPGRMPWDEIVTMRAATYMGKPAVTLEDEEDAQGARSASTLWVEGTRILRVYKEARVAGQVAFDTTYTPGFLRYDEAWTSGSSVVESYDSLQRCVMASAASKCAPGALRMQTTSHTFHVVSLNAEVTVPAGTFRNAVEVERINLGDPQTVGDEDTKHYWFAPGVGKVRELDLESGAAEDLTTFEIP